MAPLGDVMETAVSYRVAQSGLTAQLRDLVGPAGAPPLISRPIAEVAAEPRRRGRIWDFHSNLHCSIIGTCLSTTELRKALGRLNLAPSGSSDHELHSTAVGLAGRQGEPARVLNKALDARHRLAINRFAKASSETELRALWQDAVQRGDIPGAYWAVLTHPATTAALVRTAFGEVHMLSHLVGSANRADLQRLCRLEQEKAALEARLERQQQAFHDAVVSRNHRIEELERRAAARTHVPSHDDADLRGIIAGLERRLAAEAQRRETAEMRLTEATESLADLRAVQARAEALEHELASVEALLRPVDPGAAGPMPAIVGQTLLYVGGRPNQVPHMRAIIAGFGAEFLHHDGGVENQTAQLPGLASRADLILFPVDCVSHEAVLLVKTFCRQHDKRFVALRSASLASLVAALATTEPRLAEAAD